MNKIRKTSRGRHAERGAPEWSEELDSGGGVRASKACGVGGADWLSASSPAGGAIEPSVNAAGVDPAGGFALAVSVGGAGEGWAGKDFAGEDAAAAEGAGGLGTKDFRRGRGAGFSVVFFGIGARDFAADFWGAGSSGWGAGSGRRRAMKKRARG